MNADEPITCEERIRLLEINLKAQKEPCELEEELGRSLVSDNHGLRRKAKSDIEKARRRAGKTFMALMSHQQKHGCHQRGDQMDPFPLISNC